MKSDKMILVLLNIILLNSLLLGQFVHAKSVHQHGNSLDSHVHGVSELMIAIDGKILEIEFISPAANLIGFEHKASTSKEVAIVNETKELLSKTSTLFTFSGGRCSLIDADIDVTGLIRIDDHDKDNTEHEHHSQVVASYRYQCEDNSDLSSINVGVFNQFLGVEKINAVWISNTQQGAKTLNTENTVISLR